MEFNDPFLDLFIWAVLSNIHPIAALMYKSHSNPLPKALIGLHLNRQLEKFCASREGYTNAEEDFKSNAK